MESYKLQELIDKEMGHINSLSLKMRNDLHFRIEHENEFIRYFIYNNVDYKFKCDFIFKNSSINGMMIIEGEYIRHN